MSSPSLVNFIQKLNTELEGFSEYRKALNRKPQTFVFNKRSLLAETVKQIEAKSLQKGKIPAEIKAGIKVITNKYGDILVKELKTIAGKPNLKMPGGKLTMVFDESTEVEVPEYYDTAIPISNYAKVRLAYKNTLNAMFIELQEYLRTTEIGSIKNNDNTEKRSILGFFDSGHEDKAGVFERFLYETTQAIAAEVTKTTNEDSQEALDSVTRALSTEGFVFSIQKIDAKDTIVLKVESAFLNRSRGSKVGNFSKRLRGKINKFLASENLAELEGSDSFKTKKRKKLLRETKQAFENIPGVTVKFEDTTAKPSSSSPSKISVGTKVSPKRTKVSSQGVKPRSARSSNRPGPDLASQALRLVQQINQKLPEAIISNMTYPRLVNRTGTFAGSAKVVDVNQTRQGYLSFGYTYDKFPYQTFEPGYAQGSPDRDPRRLIDRSIRDIATELALGRFYTRRL